MERKARVQSPCPTQLKQLRDRLGMIEAELGQLWASRAASEKEAEQLRDRLGMTEAELWQVRLLWDAHWRRVLEAHAGVRVGTVPWNVRTIWDAQQFGREYKNRKNLRPADAPPRRLSMSTSESSAASTQEY